MTSFSERYGYRPIRTQIQKDSMDERLRNALWNILYEDFVEPLLLKYDRDFDFWAFTRCFWKKFDQLVDELPDNPEDCVFNLKHYFFDCDWHEVYSLLEYVMECATQALWDPSSLDALVEGCNIALERNVSAFRFVAGKISEMTSEYEIDAVECAMMGSRLNDPVSVHLSAAAENVFSRDAPDYRNSIKEAILAVEAMCRSVTGRDKVTLGDCMKTVSAHASIHPAFRDALIKLYGWTNDDSGIRHALTAKPTVTFDDAKFMLVTCSAFVSYLRAKSVESTKS